MPVNITCRACHQVVAALDSMAGKKAVCPNCRTVFAIAEQFAPAAIVDPIPSETASPEPSSDHEIPSSLDIIQPPQMNSQIKHEKAALCLVVMVNIFFRYDWRRLPTCTHLWFVFFLFFLPWVNVACNGRTLLTQTGLQTVTARSRWIRSSRKWRAIIEACNTKTC